MIKNRFLTRCAILFVAVLLSLNLKCFAESGVRPNILLIISDDHNHTHTGFTGNPNVKTPTIDKLAQEGTLFPTAYVPMSRCRPTLAGFLSGMYPHQHGIYYNSGPDQLNAKYLLPALLRDTGYATFAQGKYWEGKPERLGFTHGKGKDYFFVRRDQKDLFKFFDKLKNQNFFVWYAPRIPHVPLRPPKEFLNFFKQDDIPIPSWVPKEKHKRYREIERLSFAMEYWLDASINAVLEKLKEKDLLKNTLVIFVIDNGWCNGLVSKGSAFEMGLRTPVIFYWPDHIKSGQVIPKMISALDIVPTILDYAGIAPPESMAGKSLKPAIEGKNAEFRDTLFGAIYPSVASKNPAPESDVYAFYARTEKWKYIFYVKDITEDRNNYFRIQHVMTDFPARKAGDQDLYYLPDDPFERNNLSQNPEHEEMMKDLKKKTLNWWHETGGKELPKTLVY